LKNGCAVQIGALHFRFSVGKRTPRSWGNYCRFFLSKVVEFLRASRSIWDCVAISDKNVSDANCFHLK
jgi:hypothetical protein